MMMNYPLYSLQRIKIKIKEKTKKKGAVIYFVICFIEYRKQKIIIINRNAIEEKKR